jgi:peptidoglycan hydrolase CwlO-like protein
MKTKKSYTFILAGSLAVFVFSANSFAQQTTQPNTAEVTESVIKATERIQNLRAQVEEIQSKEEKLRERLLRIDEEMLPASLEKLTVAAGSTRPEEIRDSRRRQLENEKTSIQKQIDLLAQSRQRLEMSIATTQPVVTRQSGAEIANQNINSELPSAGAKTGSVIAPSRARIQPRKPVVRKPIQKSRRRTRQ